MQAERRLEERAPPTEDRTVEYTPQMQTIQIVLEEGLLKAADQEVKRLKTNRSKLFRKALREHLKRNKLKDDEDRERAAYLRTPEGEEMVAFEKVTAWPED